jgi:hypothetical protein
MSFPRDASEVFFGDFPTSPEWGAEAFDCGLRRKIADFVKSGAIVLTESYRDNFALMGRVRLLMANSWVV